MGLLKAGAGALTGVLADTWREYFYCEALDTDTLVAKGAKRTSSRSSNTKGEDNIISNGSIIAVNEGQCMILVDQGKITDFSAEPGEFLYDTSTEPSLFYGSLGENIKNSFNELGKRFGFGGLAAKDQRVYFVNIKEILGNKYGTPGAVPFRVVDNNIGLDIDIGIRCHGEYSYKITDPLIFYRNVTGNVSDTYTRDEIDSQLRTELMTALQPAFAKISEMGIRYSALPGHTTEIADALNEVLSTKWGQERGIEVASFGITSVKASEEDEQLIKTLQKNAALRDPTMAAATLVGSQSEAMIGAANNQNAGAFMGFAGMNMAQNAGGMNAQNLFAMGQQQNQQQASQQASAPAGDEWACPKCGKKNTGKFCAECGEKKPESAQWTCSCGKINVGKFCSECGKAMPQGFKCDKCGWEPKPGEQPPKFCPECGDKFDENDLK